MKRSGFTMIELIFVIVILGILAAVAVPRLASVQDDAIISTEQAGIGAVRSGIQAINGKIMIRGADFPYTVLKEDGQEVTVDINATDIVSNKIKTLSVDFDNSDDAVQALANKDGTLAIVLDPGSDRTKWATYVAGSGDYTDASADTNDTAITGPASDPTNGIGDSNALINTSSWWLYKASSGTVSLK